MKRLSADKAAAQFLDMGGTSPLRVPRIGPAFRFARRVKISARSAERWPVPCGLLRWTAMDRLDEQLGAFCAEFGKVQEYR
jgi:hypothetical protein